MYRDASTTGPATADENRTSGGPARSAQSWRSGAAVLTADPALEAPSEGTVFLVERVMPGLRAADLDSLQHVLEEACRRVSSDGEFVRYLRSTFVPSQGRWLGVFRASGAEAVERVKDLAQLPGLRIEAVTEMWAESP